MRNICFCLVAFLSTSVAAALPPFSDSVEQYSAILATAGLSDALGARPINAIVRRTDGLTFDVRSLDQAVRVDLTAYPPADGTLGPVSYVGKLVNEGT